MTKPLILLLLTAAVLAGCSRDDTPDLHGQGVEIHFMLPQIEPQGEPQLARTKASDPTMAYTSATYLPSAERNAQSPVTRNAHLPATRGPLDEQTTVRVVAYKAASGTTTPQTANYVAEQTYVSDAAGGLTPCTVNADGSFAAAAPGEALRLIVGDYDFFAITPALPLDASRTGTDVPNGTDYATSRTAAVVVRSSESTKSVALTQLQRQTARIILMVQKSPAYTSLNLLQVDGDPTKQGVVLDGLAPTLRTVVLGAALTQGTGTADNKLVFPAAQFTQTDATQVTMTTCVLPKTATDLALSYDLIQGKLVSGTQINTQMSLSGTVPALSLIAGSSYRFILTVGPTSTTLSVDMWDSGGNSNNDLGKAPSVLTLSMDAGDAVNPEMNNKGYIYHI